MRFSFLLLLAPVLSAQSTLFQHARIIDGTGQTLEDASLLVTGDRIIGINAEHAKQALVIDARGKTIIPGLINAHGHLGITRGAKSGPEDYTPENISSQLSQYARYGVTSILSLGLNPDLIYDLRTRQQHGSFASSGAAIFTAGRGIGVPAGAPPLNLSDTQVYRPATADDARAAVREMSLHRPDIVKIWVDDIRGAMPKMQPEIYRAVIDEAHRRHLRVAAHIYYLADAAALVDLGVDVIAHSVRDQDVTPAFVQAMKEKGVYYIPTLELDDSFFLYADHPEWLNDPFLASALNPDLRTMLASREWRDKTLSSPGTRKDREAFETATRNLRALHAAGVKIAMGTDSGATPLRVQGFAEHLELELMTQAGLSPMEALLSATTGAAAICGITDRGTLEAGKAADLVLLDANPLDDIRNTRKISAVWQDGRKVSSGATGR